MPGPRNTKRRKLAQIKKEAQKRHQRGETSQVDSCVVIACPVDGQGTDPNTGVLRSPERSKTSGFRNIECHSGTECEYEPRHEQDERVSVPRYRPLRSQPLQYPAPARIKSERQQGRARDASRIRCASRSPCSLRSVTPTNGHSHHEDPLEYAQPCLLSPELPSLYLSAGDDGFHVLDVPNFLASSFAKPPSLNDALCAELAQPEVLEMLREVLPRETAEIVWYNRTRLRSRICPVCKRLYSAGDTLYGPTGGDKSPSPARRENTRSAGGEESRRRLREQEISGICSALCFLLAAHRYPAALRDLWGHVAEEVGEASWRDLCAGDRDAHVHDKGMDEHGKRSDLGLGRMLRMTRCPDLGLQDLLFPGLDLESVSVEGELEAVETENGENEQGI